MCVGGLTDCCVAFRLLGPKLLGLHGKKDYGHYSVTHAPMPVPWMSRYCYLLAMGACDGDHREGLTYCHVHSYVRALMVLIQLIS